MTGKPRRRDRLEARLGYRFADPELLDIALTHSSAVSPGKRVAKSYQRLEFLGDRVLGLVVADILFRRLTKASEGDLNRTFVTLVRRETCTALARQLELGGELVLGEGEKRNGGADNDAILGDAFEALLAAIYLDGGLGHAYDLIERLLGNQVEHAMVQRADAKTTLQEWAQSRGLEPPDYVLIDRAGPEHAPEFTIEARLSGFEAARAVGHSKRVAEQEAAQRFLVREKIWKDQL
jgi:ribonuclease-3